MSALPTTPISLSRNTDHIVPQLTALPLEDALISSRKHALFYDTCGPLGEGLARALSHCLGYDVGSNRYVNVIEATNLIAYAPEWSHICSDLQLQCLFTAHALMGGLDSLGRFRMVPHSQEALALLVLLHQRKWTKHESRPSGCPIASYERDFGDLTATVLISHFPECFQTATSSPEAKTGEPNLSLRTAQMQEYVELFRDILPRAFLEWVNKT